MVAVLLVVVPVLELVVVLRLSAVCSRVLLERKGTKRRVVPQAGRGRGIVPIRTAYTWIRTQY